MIIRSFTGEEVKAADQTTDNNVNDWMGVPHNNQHGAHLPITESQP